MQENHADCSTEPAQSAQPVDTTIQSDPSQKSDKP